MADSAQDPSLPQKKSARRRLVGAALLCLALAIGLPFVFDAEPKRADKPKDVAVSVAVPKTSGNDKGSSKASGSTANDASVVPPAIVKDVKDSKDTKEPAVAAVEPQAPSVAPPATVPSSVTPPPSTDSVPAPVSAPKKPIVATTPLPSTVGDVIAMAEKPKSASGDKADKSDKADKADKSEKTSAKDVQKDGKSKDSGASKYLLQIGAFGSPSGAEEQVKRAAAAGAKAYTEEVSTATGKKMIRVRVGPFTSKDLAEKTREKLKSGGIDAALIAP